MLSRFQKSFGGEMGVAKACALAFQHSAKYTNIYHYLIENLIYGGAVYYVINQDRGE